MPDYSEYIQIRNNTVEYRNHYRGDYTFMCDILWGELETRRIIQNQTIGEFKGDNPLSRIIINYDTKEIFLDIGIEEHENGLGIVKTELILKILSKSWDKWHVTRFVSGYDDVIRYMNNYNPELKPLLASIQKRTPNYDRVSWDEPKGILVSVINGDKIKYEILNKNIAEIILEGTALLNLVYDNKIQHGRIPFGGIHIDEVEGTMKIWYTLKSIDMDKWATKYWNGWKISNDELNCMNHFNLIGFSDTYLKSKSNLKNKAIIELRDEIINTDKEPFIDGTTYQFRERQMNKEEMTKRFDELITNLD